jgi:hypothetical protein
MSTFPTTKTPNSITPLVVPAAFVSVPAQGGKVVTRKHTVAGQQWTETYRVTFDKALDRGWVSQVQALFYAGATITNKQHPYQSSLLGTGGTGRVSGSGQTGASVITNGWTANSHPFLAGDIIQFASGSYVTPTYQVTNDVTASAGGVATVNVTPDVLDEFKPAHSSSIYSGTSVTMQCTILSLSLPEFGTEPVGSVVITFREVL